MQEYYRSVIANAMGTIWKETEAGKKITHANYIVTEIWRELFENYNSIDILRLTQEALTENGLSEDYLRIILVDDAYVFSSYWYPLFIWLYAPIGDRQLRMRIYQEWFYPMEDKTIFASPDEAGVVPVGLNLYDLYSANSPLLSTLLWDAWTFMLSYVFWLVEVRDDNDNADIYSATIHSAVKGALQYLFINVPLHIEDIRYIEQLFHIIEDIPMSLYWGSKVEELLELNNINSVSASYALINKAELHMAWLSIAQYQTSQSSLIKTIYEETSYLSYITFSQKWLRQKFFK